MKKRSFAVAFVAVALLAGLMAGTPARAGSGCQAQGAGATASCTFKLAGTHLFVGASVSWSSNQPVASNVATIVSATTGLELLRCEHSQTDSSYAGCFDQIANSLIRAGLPATEELVCEASGSGTPAYASVECRSWGSYAFLG
ncbi:MAG: hypothetical protein ACRDJM_09090 [Actinomycetota bacterium]